MNSTEDSTDAENEPTSRSSRSNFSEVSTIGNKGENFTDPPISTSSSSSSLSTQPKSASSKDTSSSSSLSGYFNKLGVKGGIRNYKRRWFSYNSQDCKLYYYRGPGEVVPIGEVDIRRATFSLHPQFKESSFIIKIISHEKHLLLETNDRQVALHWFYTLQELRKQFIIDETASKLNSQDNVNSSDQKETHLCINPKLESVSAPVNSIFYDSSATKDDSNMVNKVDSEQPEPKSNRLSVFSRIRSRSSYLQSSKKESNKSNGCCQCVEYENQIINLTDDLKAVENELEASREVIKVLQLQLEAAIKEKETLIEICKSHSISEQMLHTMSQREKELTLNESRLKQAENKVEQLTNESQRLIKERDDACEQLNLMKELIQVKDQTVMSLTNEIYDLERVKKDEMNLNERNEQRKAEQDELESLRDSVNAYQLQNKCLNKEIIALNEIRTMMEKKQQELQLKCYDWEARCCQVHSKLLSLLKELNQTIEMGEENENGEEQLISNNQSVKALVSRLLEESSLDIPLSWKPGNRKRSEDPGASSNEADYDDLGFSLKQPDFEVEFGEKFTIKTDALNKIKKTETSNQPDAAARQHFEWKYRWDSFVGNLSSNELSKSLELKVLLRTGVPQEYRCKIWRMLINLRIKVLKDKRGGPSYYQRLLQKTAERKVNPAAKQIELDLLRTLPNNKHFESIKSPGIMRLRQVLTCYSLHNPTVGYCQGMNRLAAVALLFMPEEDAFWCLVAIIENIMPPEYFTANLLGAHVDQYVLRDLLAEKIPALHSHLEKHGIELSLFSWFLTCFVDNVPSNIYLRIWDVFLYEGNKVLFRFALAFLKYHSQTILAMNDSLSINQYIRLLGYRTLDVNHLCHISFNLLNPFRMSKIKAKRLHYTQLVTSELNKLDQIRKTLPVHENNDNSDSD